MPKLGSENMKIYRTIIKMAILCTGMASAASADTLYSYPTPNGGFYTPTPNGTTYSYPTPNGGFYTPTPNGTIYSYPTPNGGF
jgi:hypothetical protein